MLNIECNGNAIDDVFSCIKSIETRDGTNRLTRNYINCIPYIASVDVDKTYTSVTLAITGITPLLFTIELNDERVKVSHASVKYIEMKKDEMVDTKIYYDYYLKHNLTQEII